MYKLSNFIVAIFLINIVNVYTAEEKDWWQTATVYQIYPKSFKDSDGDGVGDLKGIIEKIDYIKDLGVDVIWLSPIYKSPQYDAGYDISDFRDIDPVYGTLEIFQELVDQAHSRGLKVVLDYVPNHTSDQHEWFQKALKGDARYKDYFVWVDGKDGTKNEPPNNWISVFTHSAWEWVEDRKQFYLHQFLKQQPDLNFSNPNVRQEMKDIMTYWIDEFDIDGVRIDAVPHLIEAKNLTDEPRTYNPNATDINYNYLDHIFTRNQPGSYDLVYEWRSHIDSISARKPTTKVCFSEAVVDIDHVIPFYGNADGSKLGAHFSFNFILMRISSGSTAGDVSNLIKTWFTKLPGIYTSNWVLGNHDNSRVASKAGKKWVDALNMLAGVLPGVQVTYNGEEIGMEDGEVKCEQGVDMASNCSSYAQLTRDFERTPLQWDNSDFGGFTDGTTPWLPVSVKKAECNVADQLKDPKSHLSIYKKLQEIRKGGLADIDSVEYGVFGDNGMGLKLVKENSAKKYVLLLNLGSKSLNVETSETFELLLTSKDSQRNWGQTIAGPITLQPYESLLLLKHGY